MCALGKDRNSGVTIDFCYTSIVTFHRSSLWEVLNVSFHEGGSSKEHNKASAATLIQNIIVGREPSQHQLIQ